MEPGQSSGTKAGGDGVWARLVPEDCRYAEIDIQEEDAKICSETSCSSSEKQNWCVITRNPDGKAAKIRNIRSSWITVEGKILQKEETTDIQCGSKIAPTLDSKGGLHYIFDLPEENKNEEKFLMVRLDAENSKCSICLNIWHDVVTVAPCLHNFCNGCFSEWLRRSQKNRQTVLCPQCRAAILSVGRNHFLHNIEEVLGVRKISSRKRALPTNDGIDDDNMQLHCPQCVAPFAGFRCNRSTVHLQCHACAGMMPSRDDVRVPQICKDGLLAQLKGPQ